MVLDYKKDYSGFQTGARRLEAAMSGIPDRFPVYAQLHEFAMRELGISARKFYTTPDIITLGSLEVTERYGIDVGYVDYDVYNIEAEALGQEIIFSDIHMPDVDRAKPLIASPDDLKVIKSPDFAVAGRFPKVMELQGLFEKLTGVPATLQYTAPFSLAANLRGIEPLIMDIYANPDFARGLFDALVEEVLAPWILYQKQHFPNATSIVGSDATASLPIVNMSLLEEWVAPYILRLREICGPEVYVPNWVGERYLKLPERLMELKLRVCPGFLEGQDPDVEALGPQVFKDFANKKGVPLILGLGAGFLANSTPEKVRDRARQYVKVGGENGRFALYLCNLGASTPPENVKEAVDAAHTYGDYNR
jgi:uroporphyrinogen-III decarboxylase